MSVICWQNIQIQDSFVYILEGHIINRLIESERNFTHVINFLDIGSEHLRLVLCILLHIDVLFFN